MKEIDQIKVLIIDQKEIALNLNFHGIFFFWSCGKLQNCVKYNQPSFVVRWLVLPLMSPKIKLVTVRSCNRLVF